MLRTALEAISGGYILENHQDSEGERTLLQFSQQVPGKVKNKSYCLKKNKKNWHLLFEKISLFQELPHVAEIYLPSA